MNLSSVKCITSLVSKGPIPLLFHELQKTAPKISEFIISQLLKSCGKITALEEGSQVHCLILKHGFNQDMIIMTSLLDMYSKCSSINDAENVFVEMPERDIVATNSMIHGLCRSGSTSKAVKMFNNMDERDEGSWNSLISGLSCNLEGDIALDFYERMRLEGVKVDVITMVSVLSICADLAALSNGRKIHGLVVKFGFELFLPVGNAIVDMYAKCGSMENACVCFNHMAVKNVVSWTCLIVGYGKHGRGIEALKALDAMESEQVVPNKITFLGALYACSHAGLVQEGWRIFNIMMYKYSITPIMEHYTCMVDLLARAGRLDDAYNFMEKMPVKPDARFLTAFLSSCCSFMNVELAKSVGDRLLQLVPQEAGAYMLLSNFYGLVGDSERVANVRRLMLKRGIRKQKAYTMIEIDRKVHSFESGDRSHPLSRKIYSCLHNVVKKMKKIGYVPNTSMVMQNVDDDAKEEIVLGHSEKLAIGLALISTPPGTPITFVKNLRVCVDCHIATALISKIEDREIIARDSNRFHHFKDGLCSCGNQW
ncbi:pentatricopeptide repeat-containing protein ELI1, chloroplastic-like [Mercurialis annua]|uniref:pentatricopeptide repeat-containing protein ELI1, chloroplastic-like n=1 Tax=Mercurialis annua TaxID=3986 RepID=UPI002160363C|nr:pentatricopeptide repeat-containing protein ELI1, chloroplastic-like [Mercurialis annua]